VFSFADVVGKETAEVLQEHQLETFSAILEVGGMMPGIVHE